jgi:uncharacterized damage-inducible protein DinB
MRFREIFVHEAVRVAARSTTQTDKGVIMIYTRPAMNRLAVTFFLGALLLAGPAALRAVDTPVADAGTLSQKDRDYGVESLLQTRQRLLDAISGLSDAQWRFKPGPDRWSIAEVTEHLAVSEPVLFNEIKDGIVKAPPVAVPAEKKISDEKVFELTLDRSVKNMAPDMLQPTGRWSTREDLTKAFLDVREQTLNYMRTTKDDLRAHAEYHSGLGTPDAFQWLLFISAHTARHTLQIEEVKAAPGYPKN